MEKPNLKRKRGEEMGEEMPDFYQQGNLMPGAMYAPRLSVALSLSLACALALVTMLVLTLAQDGAELRW